MHYKFKVEGAYSFRQRQELRIAFWCCPCSERDSWSPSLVSSLRSLTSYCLRCVLVLVKIKKDDSIIYSYPLCRRLTISKFSFAIRSSSLFLTPSFKLRGFILIDLLVTCYVVGTDARLPWEISRRFLISMALFLLIWFSRSICRNSTHFFIVLTLDLELLCVSFQSYDPVSRFDPFINLLCSKLTLCIYQPLHELLLVPTA